MEQHAIPQQISSYQFRLVGDMTLKQFFQLAGGLLVALIFYSAPIIGIIKWPFVIISALLGVGLAFLPLEERPLDRWILAFFKAIYAPTEFYWKKTAVPQKFFQDETQPTPTTPTSQQEQSLQEYLGSSAQKSAPLTKLEGAEKGFLSALTGIFSGIIPQAFPVSQNIPAGTVPVTIPQQTAPAPTSPAQQKSEVQIPETPAIRVVPEKVPHLVVEEKPVSVPSLEPQITTQKVSPLLMGEEMVSARQALFSIEAAPPNPPTIPNVVVGQITDTERKIVEGAIMEIKDSGGRPIRAIRSNKLGHFITVTPLENGQYQIITEKEGFEFSPVSFSAVGTIIPPISVQGKRILTPTLPAQEPSATNVYIRTVN